MKKHFVQDWGTYGNETIVAVGYNRQETERIVKKIAGEIGLKSFRDQYERHLGGSHAGYFLVILGTHYTLLSLADFKKNNAHSIGVLVHELEHAIDFILKDYYGFSNEYEARAYQIQYLFKNIYKKLTAK